MKKVQRKSTPWRTSGNRSKITSIRPPFFLIFSQNIGSFEKYVQALVRRTSSDFKTPQSSLKNTRLRVAFSIPLGVWKGDSGLNYYIKAYKPEHILGWLGIFLISEIFQQLSNPVAGKWTCLTTRPRTVPPAERRN